MWKTSRKILALFLTGCMLLGFSACQKQESVDIYVSAASSLTESLTEIADYYMAENKNVMVHLNFGGSGTLKMQILQGVPANLFLSASAAQYEELLQAGKLMEGAQFLSNKLCLVTPKDSTKVTSVWNMADKGVAVVFANESVPIGQYAKQVLEQMDAKQSNGFAQRVEANIVSREENVRQVLAKIALGEGDCALVYTTDITEEMKDKVTVIEVPQEFNIKGSYSIGVVPKQNAEAEAQRFYDYILSQKGSEIFIKYGFEVW